jgi:hypothetical protein
MAINLDSTSDSKEAVAAALGDLADSKKPVEEKPTEELPTDEAEPVNDELAKVDDEVVEEDLEEENEPEELEAKPEDGEPKPKKKGGFQKRIDKLNTKISATEQEKEYWRNEALRAQQNATKPEPTLDKPDTSSRPKADTFTTHDEYVEALTDWKLDQKLLAIENKQKENAVKSEVQTKVTKYQERVTEFQKSHDDWQDAIDSVSDIPLSITVREAIFSSENGPDIAYALSKDPTELKRVCALSPVKAAMELGKLEARFSKTTSKPSDKKTTKAPAPVNPVRTRGAVSNKSLYDADKMSQSEWNRLRDEQVKQKQLRG